MFKTTLRSGALALLAAATAGGAVQAGGFNRGTADTDLLFEDGTVVIRGEATYVAPRRGYNTINGVASGDPDYSDNYFVPNFAAKFQIMEQFACVATYTQPFGGSTTYGPQAQLAEFINTGNATFHKEFITHEYGATCDYKVAAGQGNFHLLGGVFLQSFSYTEETAAGTLDLDDNSALGYRIGGAYEIPEYAFRAQIMYRSEIEHDVEGQFQQLGLAPLLGSVPVYADGAGTLPQSLKVSLQTGVAPGWLVYGSVEWTDWSVLQTLDYNIAGLGPLSTNYFWRDGWTVQAGVAHSFTESVAGTVNLTWDRGVGTGADIMSDTWTVGVGTSIKGGPGELRLGAGVSYLTSGSQSVADGASYNATADGDYAYGLTASYMIKF